MDIPVKPGDRNMLGAILCIVFGLVILAYGSRLVIFGAGVGALLGVWLLSIIPRAQESWLWLLLPVGLAILFALGIGIVKSIIGFITLALGAMVGGTIVLNLLGMFGFDWGLMNWILAIIGAVIGAMVLSRFKDWAVIIMAAVVGAMLCTRGLQMMIPSIQGTVASLISLVLTGIGIILQSGIFGKKKKEAKPK
jgi:hypothetical protein